MLNIGCDIVEIERIAAALQRRQRFLEMHFTCSEREYFAQFKTPIPRIAGHFAAKEAVAKALGCGMRHPLSFATIDISHDTLGRPRAQLLNPALRSWPDTVLEISISHTETVAMATALAHKTVT